MPDDLLESSEAARLLGVSAQTVRQWERMGRLPALKTAGGRRLFKRADVEALREQRDQPSPDAQQEPPNDLHD